MAKPIQSILHHENFIKVIEKVKGGVPGGILPEEMFRATKRIIGNQGTYTKVESTREVAQTVMYGSPSKNVTTKGVSKQAVTLVHAYEHFNHEPNLLALLKSTDNRDQQLGAEEVGRKTREFAQRYVNLRRAAWYLALTTGKIYLDGDGNLLPSSSGAVITIDFGVPAGNQNQLDWDGGGAIIGASWATAATDIASQIAEIQQAAASLSGYPITTAYYGRKIPGYLASNTTMKEFLKMIPASRQSIAKGIVPDGFLELKWRPAYTAFYVDKDGTTQWFWGDDTVVFTPDVTDAGWWGLLEGSYAIPTNLGQVYGDAIAALNSLRKVFGMFSYAQVTHDPVVIRQYAGDTFLPVINVPKSIFIADVTTP